MLHLSALKDVVSNEGLLGYGLLVRGPRYFNIAGFSIDGKFGHNDLDTQSTWWDQDQEGGVQRWTQGSQKLKLGLVD